ncbi:MAG TPA: VOC family protein [Frankiaceae bacterium]|jgi:PhnB protein|nr:VOC family protein [Frankiaceae bacterium]
MASRLNPYLAFPGTAREAMTFYESALGGTLEIVTFEDAGAQDAPDPKQVMHARLETAKGFTLMASDLPPGADHVAGTNVAVSLSGDDEAELRGYWDALSADSTITMPLEKQMWGDVFGSCTDRFGIHWMVNISQPAG